MPSTPGYRNYSIPEDLAIEMDRIVQLRSLGLRTVSEAMTLAGRSFVMWHNGTFLRERAALDRAAQAAMREAAETGAAFGNPYGAPPAGKKGPKTSS